jgi:uncharacterized protein (DUF433 family)
MENFPRITHTPGVMGGQACIRGMRVTVSLIVGMASTGKSHEAMLALYPYLEKEDIEQALGYAAWRMQERDLPLASV